MRRAHLLYYYALSRVRRRKASLQLTDIGLDGYAMRCTYTGSRHDADNIYSRRHQHTESHTTHAQGLPAAIHTFELLLYISRFLGLARSPSRAKTLAYANGRKLHDIYIF